MRLPAFVPHLHGAFVGAADLAAFVGRKVEDEAVVGADFGDCHRAGRDEPVNRFVGGVAFLAIGTRGQHGFHEFHLLARCVGAGVPCRTRCRFLPGVPFLRKVRS